jgi:hypothetical protein
MVGTPKDRAATDLCTAVDKESHGIAVLLLAPKRECELRLAGPSTADTFGNSRHSWMRGEVTMTNALGEIGFIDIRRCSFGENDDFRFGALENMKRFANGSVVAIADTITDTGSTGINLPYWRRTLPEQNAGHRTRGDLKRLGGPPGSSERYPKY